LAGELSGILNWALAGAMQHAKSGEPKPIPRRVDLATREYESEQNCLEAFLETECFFLEQSKVGKKPFYNAYKAFAGGKCESSKEFNRKLIAKGIQDGILHGGAACWKGIGLTTQGRPSEYGDVGDMT
jgi:phage/plasmid-associated DNA primase